MEVARQLVVVQTQPAKLRLGFPLAPLVREHDVDHRAALDLAAEEVLAGRHGDGEGSGERALPDLRLRQEETRFAPGDHSVQEPHLLGHYHRRHLSSCRLHKLVLLPRLLHHLHRLEHVGRLRLDRVRLRVVAHGAPGDPLHVLVVQRREAPGLVHGDQGREDRLVVGVLPPHPAGQADELIAPLTLADLVRYRLPLAGRGCRHGGADTLRGQQLPEYEEEVVHHLLVHER